MVLYSPTKNRIKCLIHYSVMIPLVCLTLFRTVFFSSAFRTFSVIFPLVCTHYIISVSEEGQTHPPLQGAVRKHTPQSLNNNHSEEPYLVKARSLIVYFESTSVRYNFRNVQCSMFSSRCEGNILMLLKTSYV